MTWFCIHIWSKSEEEPTGMVLVLRECRREYIDPKRAKRSSSAPTAPHSTPKKQKLRSKQDLFDWKRSCFLCKEEMKSDSVHPDRYPHSRRVQVLTRSLKGRGGLTHGRGLTESVRTVWIYSMHACAEYHNALSSLTKLQHTISDQYEEMGKGRVKRDFQDLQKLIGWLKNHNPFDQNRSHLQTLDTGLIVDETEL